MPKNRTAWQAELLLPLARYTGSPLRAQLEERLRTAIRGRTLRAGDRLPSSRTLAHDLGVSRGVVVEAYAQLAAEGYLISRPGSATVVAPVAAQPERTASAPDRAAGLRYDFRPGAPDLQLFPRAAWSAAVRSALRSAAASDLGYGDPAGTLRLRHEMAAYLRRVRGVVVDAAQLVICNGFAQGLGLVCRVLRDAGLRELAMEDPAHPGQRALVVEAGLQAVPIPVDAEGLCVDALAASGARAVLITPAHQFPTGIVYSAAPRAQLLAWARERQGLVLEDDYDAEYRYDRAPVGALQGLDPQRVIYAGSASKMLAPALRIGWLAVPARYVEAVVAAKQLADLGSPALEQLAFADFLERGMLDRHLRRARLAYRERRDALLEALKRHAPRLELRGVSAGLHAVVGLPAGSDEQTVVATTRAAGVGVYALGDYYVGPAPREPALVLGYAAMTPGAIDAAVAILARSIA